MLCDRDESERRLLESRWDMWDAFFLIVGLLIISSATHANILPPH